MSLVDNSVDVEAAPDAQQYLLYTQEYMGIVHYLLDKGIAEIQRGFVTVEKQTLLRLLCRNAYEMPENKLKVWRGLGWIVTDPGRLTKRIRKEGRVIPAVKINVAVYNTLETLYPCVRYENVASAYKTGK